MVSLLTAIVFQGTGFDPAPLFQSVVSNQRESVQTLIESLTKTTVSDTARSRTWVKSANRDSIICAYTVEFAAGFDLGGERNTLYNQIGWREITQIQIEKPKIDSRKQGQFSVTASGPETVYWGYGDSLQHHTSEPVVFEFNSVKSAKDAATLFYRAARLMGSKCKLVNKTIDF